MLNLPELPVLVAILAGGGAGACGAWVAVQTLDRARRARALARDEIVVTETTSALVKVLLPVARHLGKGVRGALRRRRADGAPGGFYTTFHRRLTNKLAAAGYPQGLDADEYVGFCIFAALAGGGGGVVMHLLVADMFDVYLCFIGGLLLGLFYMPLWLKGRTEERRKQIRKELPFALDLLTLATEAGLDFSSALDRIVRKLGASPLGDEFRIMLREIRLGKPRSDAMRDLGRRVEVMEVQSVMTSLVQAEEMGSNIGPILRIQAAQQRENRSQRAEEMAGKAPVKLLFPLLIIMVVTFLIIFGAMWLSFS